MISHPAPGSTNKYECKGMEGRYLNIVIQRQKQYLTLCEVKVTGEPSGKPDPIGDFNHYFILSEELHARVTKDKSTVCKVAAIL